MERLDSGRSLRRLSLCRDDEVPAPDAHVRAQNLADAVTSHLRLDVDVETCKSPYLAGQLLVFRITG